MAVFIGAVRSKPRKPRGNVISTLAAREIAMGWHGGQWSALYQFGSSGVYMDSYYDLYISEIDSNLNSAKSDRGLKALKKYFQYKHWQH
jgi:hypothetical protein